MFDEITICRRATEEALSALAQHYPGVDRSDLEHRLGHLESENPKEVWSHLSLTAWSKSGGWQGTLLRKPSTRQAVTAQNAGTLKQRTGFLVKLVTMALRAPPMT